MENHLKLKRKGEIVALVYMLYCKVIIILESIMWEIVIHSCIMASYILNSHIFRSLLETRSRLSRTQCCPWNTDFVIVN